jgi:hypothetical protein
MAILVKRDPPVYEAAPIGTLATGVLVAHDGLIVGAITDPVMGIVVDSVPTAGAPYLLRIAGKGAIIEDTVLDGVADGSLVYSDGDGTYSLTEPAGAAGTLVTIFGVVRRIDTQAAGTGCEIEITLDQYEKGA